MPGSEELALVAVAIRRLEKDPDNDTSIRGATRKQNGSSVGLRLMRAFV